MTDAAPPRHPLNPRVLHACVLAVIALLVGIGTYALVRLAQAATGLR